jgi:nucleoside-diphosphate-sugar epimerase
MGIGCNSIEYLEMSVSDSVLITGGAGYIGSHAVLAFRAASYVANVVS